MIKLLLAAVLVIHFNKVEVNYFYTDGFGIPATRVFNDTGTARIKGKYILTDSTLIQRKGNVIKKYWLVK